MDNIIIQGLIFRFAGAPVADRIFASSSLEEPIMKQDPKSENINTGCKNGCTTDAACPLLPRSFPSFRVTMVSKLHLTTC